MAIAFSIFLTLCALAVTHGDPSMPCLGLTSCTSTLASADFGSGAHYAGVPADQIGNYLDNYCQNTLPTATSCVTREIPNCPRSSFVDSARSTLMVSEYTCNEDNREQIISVVQSPCMRNASVTIMLGNELEDCTSEYLDDINTMVADFTARIGTDPTVTLDLCPAFNNFKACVLDGARDLCGPHVRSFFASLWDMTIERNAPAELQHCFQEHIVTRRALRSVMPLFGIRS